jgi:ubiquinone/menaquinone biosynthesis C-methylase UbiE
MSKDDVARVYDAEAQVEWERLSVRRIEFAVTCRVLDQYLPPPPGRILDVGSGPGRYAIRLKHRGYSVAIADVSRNCLQLAEEKAAQEGICFDEVVCGTATDLTAFSDDQFDAVLLMGPLYHLKLESERAEAVTEAMRVARRGGVLFSAHLSRYSVLRYAAKVRPAQLAAAPGFYDSILERGVGELGNGFLDTCYCADPLEVLPFMEGLGLTTLDLVGCEGVVAEVEEKLNELPQEEFERWVDLNYRLGRQKELHAASAHLLHVGRKE